MFERCNQRTTNVQDSQRRRMCFHCMSCGEETEGLLGAIGFSNCSLLKQHLESLWCNFMACSTCWGHQWGGGRAEPGLSSASWDSVAGLFFFFFPLLLFKFSKCWQRTKQGNWPVGSAPRSRLSKFSRKEFNSRNLGALWANASFNITKLPHNEPEPELIWQRMSSGGRGSSGSTLLTDTETPFACNFHTVKGLPFHNIPKTKSRS